MKNMFYSRASKLLRNLLLLTLGSGYPLISMAVNCTVTPANVQMTIPISGTISYARDLPVGAVLGQFTVLWPTSDQMINCPNPGGLQFPVPDLASPYAVPVSGLTNTYKTGVDGVGYQMFTNNGSGWALDGTGYLNVNGTMSTPGRAGTAFGIRLIKTGTIAAGAVISSADLPTTLYRLYGDNQVRAWTIKTSGSAPINPVGTCQIPPVPVNLGPNSVSAFQGVGQPISTGGKPVNIALNDCPAGLNSIQYYLTPSTSSLGNGVVSLDASSSASGVGVQILDPSSVAMVFNKNYSVAYTGAGSYIIPLTARYYQTGTISAGSANTSLTFTMIYQ